MNGYDIWVLFLLYCYVGMAFLCGYVVARNKNEKEQ